MPSCLKGQATQHVPGISGGDWERTIYFISEFSVVNLLINRRHRGGMDAPYMDGPPGGPGPTAPGLLPGHDRAE